jgi:hypothetical protein
MERKIRKGHWMKGKERKERKKYYSETADETATPANIREAAAPVASKANGAANGAASLAVAAPRILPE